MSLNVPYILDVNECASDPCVYDKGCHDRVNGFVCDCLPGFTGHRCQTGKFDNCT